MVRENITGKLTRILPSVAIPSSADLVRCIFLLIHSLMTAAPIIITVCLRKSLASSLVFRWDNGTWRKQDAPTRIFSREILLTFTSRHIFQVSSLFQGKQELKYRCKFEQIARWRALFSGAASELMNLHRDEKNLHCFRDFFAFKWT